MRPIAAHPLSDPYARSAVVIDRDPVAAAKLVAWLMQQGFRVHEARDAFSGVDAAARHRPDLIIAQSDLPGIDGFETVRRVREFSDAFVILLADDDSESAVVEGFRAGADDYVLNPVRPYALRARIDAMMRRSRTLVSTAAAHAPVASETAWLEHGPLRLQPAARRVQVDGIDCELTRSEFDLLHTLVRAKDQVFSKSSLALMLRETNNLPGQHITDHDRHAVEVHIM
ncbi:MAG: hypothetical protein K0Q58_1361, partial [Microbacterium sp.]|nr:hypothetical protein [Microbacterium sp.]